MSENACKVESTVGTSTTDAASVVEGHDPSLKGHDASIDALESRSSQLEKAFALRANLSSQRVRSIRTSGMSAEGKLHGGHMTMPLDGRGCGKQTILDT